VTLRDGAALKAFDCTFENCSGNGLKLAGGQSVKNSFYCVPGEALLQDAIPTRMTLAVTSFVAFNCKFNHNGQNGVEIETLTNFYLDGKDSEMAHNTLKGMHWDSRGYSMVDGAVCGAVHWWYGWCGRGTFVGR